MKIQPLGHNLLIEPETESHVLASQEIEKDFGKIIAKGEDVTKVNVGDRVAYLKWGIKRIEVSETERYLFIAEDSPWLLGKVLTEDEGT